MNTYISMLRGINVSGHKTIKMDALKSMYEGLGFTNVRTYIQSGNIVFQDIVTDIQSLQNKISIQISRIFGFEVPVIIRTVSEIKEVIVNNPFLSKGDIQCHYVTFLSTDPATESIDKLDNRLYLPDEFKIDGKTIYLYCPNGYSKTKLTNTFFEKKLKQIATTRNGKTINTLMEIVEK